MYVLYNILKVSSVLMRGNWLFWPWKNQNATIWPWNLIFKNVSLIVACNILNWSITCLRSYKCIYATTKMKINLATMGGITVITQYVSVYVCVCQLTYSIAQCCPMWMDCYKTWNCDTQIWYFIFHCKRYQVHMSRSQKCEIYFERIIIETSGILQNM